MGITPCPNALCIFTMTPIANQPAIYLVLYVSESIYLSTSEEVKQWLKSALQSKLCIQFICNAAWILGCYYDWSIPKPGKAQVRISQVACTTKLLDKFGLSDCNLTPAPYHLGLHIDDIPLQDLSPGDAARHIHIYQSLLGSLN